MFGDALHSVHPLAGQGFNMILRDLANLQKLLANKLSLRLDIGSTNVLKQFESEKRPRNCAYSLGIDCIKKSFSSNQKSFKFFRNMLMTTINKKNSAKNLASEVAYKG